MVGGKQDKQVATAGSNVVKGSPALHPIALVDSPLAGIVSNVRPAVLLSLLYFGFNSFVARPEYFLQLSLPAVAAVQAGYAVVCLPVVGSPAARKQRPGEKKKTDSTVNPVVTAVLSLVLALLLTPAIHILFVLFGAPFLDHISRTLLCSAHFALLGLFPIIYTRGIESQSILAVAGASAPLDETFGALVGAVLGAWLGAVPIPLDWDRDWQEWPVTIVVGMYLGSALVSKLSGSLPMLYGKRMGVADDKED